MAGLKEQLNKLVQLQALDTKLYDLKTEKDILPQEIKALEAAFEEKKQRLAALEKDYLDMQKQKKERELELATKEESTNKLQTQLYSLKTNKEYQTMLQQISDSKADASVIEDKILQTMEQIDKAKLDMEQEKKNLQEEEKIFLEKKGIIENRSKEINERLQQLEAQRNQAIPGIDSNILSQYERVLSNRNGLAIVAVRDNTCSGCNMFVPPQMINLIKMYENIVTCEVCNRLLYTED